MAIDTRTFAERTADFARWAIGEHWEAMELDTCDIQDKAEALGLIRKTTFDPSKHEDHYGLGLEAGDEWFEVAPELKRTA